MKDKPLHNEAIMNALPNIYTDSRQRTYVQMLDYLTRMGYTHTLTPKDCLRAQIKAKNLINLGPFWFKPGDSASGVEAILKFFALITPILFLLAYLLR